MILPFLELVKTDFEAVNSLIIEQLHSDVGLVENIGHYIVESGGKRLRPVLVLLTARALGYRDNSHIELAAIIEFIHTATLLHDDVVDLSSLRRGRPTANAKWGNAPSVLVGDFLYSRSFQMMVKVGNMDIMSVLSNTTNIISEGEVQQLANAKNPAVTEQNYLNVIYKKTAALFEAACEIASIISNDNDTERDAAKQFGHHLGLAFQLIDDALDYSGSSEDLGKNVGDDLAEGKPTLPLIHAMSVCNSTEKALVEQAITNGELDRLKDVIDIVTRSKSIEYVKQKAQEHANSAVLQAKRFPVSPYQNAMIELAKFSVERSF